MTQLRTVLRNDFNKETFIFTETGDPDVARIDVVLGEGGSGGGNALQHVHPLADERFVVATGALKVVVDGHAQIVGPGEEAVIPKGRPHYFANSHAGETTFTAEFRPAQQHLTFFANFARLTAEHPEWFSRQGDPHFLLIASCLHRFKDHTYLARPPVFVQKALFALAAPLARWLGYKIDVRPVHAGGA